MKAIRTRVRARDITENHRVSSPLELLFDLTFVVAVGSLVAQLAHKVAEGDARCWSLHSPLRGSGFWGRQGS